MWSFTIPMDWLRGYVGLVLSGGTMIEKLTLDTMLVRDEWEDRQGRPLIRCLLALAKAGEVDLAVTRTITYDVPKPPLADEIGKLPSLGVEVTGTVTGLDETQLGVDFLGSAEFVAFYHDLGPDPELPGERDWDHLHAHWLQGRDVFLTRDGAILNVADLLRERFELLVMRLDTYLAQREDGPSCGRDG